MLLIEEHINYSGEYGEAIDWNVYGITCVRVLVHNLRRPEDSQDFTMKTEALPLMITLRLARHDVITVSVRRTQVVVHVVLG